ncbi:MAG: hypothetical protein LBT90_00910 [Holosporaceae bacterium]|jgi:hypothetical protein|nr:hypothetical protein [Holosporaceae bacterium]
MKKVILSSFAALVGFSAVVADNVSSTSSADYTPAVEAPQASDEAPAEAGTEAGPKSGVVLSFGVGGDISSKFDTDARNENLAAFVVGGGNAILVRADGKLRRFYASVGLGYRKYFANSYFLEGALELEVTKNKSSQVQWYDANGTRATPVSTQELMASIEPAVLLGAMVLTTDERSKVVRNGLTPSVVVRFGLQRGRFMPYVLAGLSRVSGSIASSAVTTEDGLQFLTQFVANKYAKIVPMVGGGVGVALTPSGTSLGAELFYRFSVKDGVNTVNKSDLNARLRVEVPVFNH